MFAYWLWVFWVYGADVTALICCSWALWKGGAAERAGALIIAIGWILTWVTESPGNGPSLGNIIVDIAALIALAILAMWSRRPWAIFASILQLNAVFTHFVHPFTVYGKYSYATVVGFWSGFALLFCLAWGTISHGRQVKRRLQQTAPSQA